MTEWSINKKLLYFETKIHENIFCGCVSTDTHSAPTNQPCRDRLPVALDADIPRLPSSVKFQLHSIVLVANMSRFTVVMALFFIFIGKILKIQYVHNHSRGLIANRSKYHIAEELRTCKSNRKTVSRGRHQHIVNQSDNTGFPVLLVLQNGTIIESRPNMHDLSSEWNIEKFATFSLTTLNVLACAGLSPIRSILPFSHTSTQCSMRHDVKPRPTNHTCTAS